MKKPKEISRDGYTSPIAGHMLFKVYKYPANLSAGDALNVLMLPYIGTFDLGYVFICQPWQCTILVVAPEGTISV